MRNNYLWWFMIFALGVILGIDGYQKLLNILITFKII